MRVDLYGTIHKAQRLHLLRLCGEMGRTDFADVAAAERVRGELRGLIAHLRDHARNEETYIHPLYRALGRPADAIEGEHKDLEESLSGLEASAEEGRWAELYSAYARFLGVYLLHLDEEEKSQAEILWPAYSDRDLLAVFQRFQSERSPADARADMRFMLTALSVPEIARIYSGIKAGASSDAFVGACALAAASVEPEVWSRVAALLQEAPREHCGV